MTLSPHEEYSRRRAARSVAFARLARLDEQISYGRLAAVGAVLIAGGLALFSRATPWWLLGPVSGFLLLAVWHDRVLRAKDSVAQALTFYEYGLARIEDRWHGTGETGGRFLREGHLYARDLDIFGDDSLFQLLSRARTHLGEDVLARWLTEPAALDVIRARQRAIEELREELDFREALATAGGPSRDIDTVALSGWASAPALPEKFWLRVAAAILAVGIFGTLAWWIRGGPLGPLLVVLLLKMILTRPSRKRVARIVRGVERPLAQLDVLADTLALIERREFRSPQLESLRSGMMSQGVVPSRAIRRLKRLADCLNWRRNAFFAPFSAALSWPLHFASAIEAWRQQFGPKVLIWLAAVAEHEALGSLAAYAYEHPADPFPELLEADSAQLYGRQLGHPLVPAARMVTNDIDLSKEVRGLVVSGSNMSGKSTLLRTVGVNVVLAMTGAPVRGKQLTMTPLALGATLHIHDSLQAGRSRFFAEISRIRAIVNLTSVRPRPLFLLDELFQGTNSYDRKIGAEALLYGLIERGAIGLTTTHDLALTAIADQSGGRIANVHFEDRLEGDRLVFDYRMKPGPVTHSNALELMKAVGLPVRPRQP